MKIITVETLKKFLDELNKKYGTEFYSKTECDERYQQKGGASVEDFYQWLKERNYDMGNFRGLEGVFPVKDFPEIKAANLMDGDTKIAGTGAPNTIVEYDGKRAQIGSDGRFLLKGITPLVDGDFIQIIYYDYAGRKKTFSAAVGKIEYAVPDGTTEITRDTVRQYNLDRSERLIFPTSVKIVARAAFGGSKKLTDVFLPACTSLRDSAFYNCQPLTNISLPSCTIVEDEAFKYCNNLKTVILSDGWTPSDVPRIPKTATVYNQDKTKKVDWNTMKWVNV